jgi:hypothetical protein
VKTDRDAVIPGGGSALRLHRDSLLDGHWVSFLGSELGRD